VVLQVTGLDGPAVGSGCCAVTPEDILVAEVDSWRGLLVTRVDCDAGTVEVLVEPGCTCLPDALDALTDRGFSPRVVIDTPPAEL
jgi:hypothetical protein